MIEWINSKDAEVPKNGKVYIGIWKGAFCLVQYGNEPSGKEGYYVCLLPAEYEKSFGPIDEELVPKIYYWAELTHPKDYI